MAGGIHPFGSEQGASSICADGFVRTPSSEAPMIWAEFSGGCPMRRLLRCAANTFHFLATSIAHENGRACRLSALPACGEGESPCECSSKTQLAAGRRSGTLMAVRMAGPHTVAAHAVSCPTGSLRCGDGYGRAIMKTWLKCCLYHFRPN